MPVCSHQIISAGQHGPWWHFSQGATPPARLHDAERQLMILSPLPRKPLLALHVGTSVGLMGAVAGFLVLAVFGIT